MNLYLQKMFYVMKYVTCFAIVLASLLCVIILNDLSFTSFVSFGTHNCGDKTLQLQIHLSKRIMNG